MANHSATSRREAAANPIVLFGSEGRTVEGYRPADEDLTAAAPGHPDWGQWRAVRGPHLRAVRNRDRRSKTGIVGISVSTERKTGRHWYMVQLGNSCRKFCVETMGATEARRRAVELRRAHLAKIAAANAVILRARRAHADLPHSDPGITNSAIRNPHSQGGAL